MMDMKKFLWYAIGVVFSLCLLSCQKDDMKGGLFQQGTLLGNYEFVDLGLSAKWASCNIGAEKPYEFGDYYAWGETETKETYTFDNYQFQHTEILPVECDVARTKMGDGWRMPTNAEVQELLDKCEWRCCYYPKTKVYGYKVNKKGNSRNFIFLPFAGRVGGDNPEEIGESGYYWTTESLGAYPYALVVRISGTTSCMNAYPVKGYTVRAVCD